MIDNPCVYELALNLDQNYIKNLVLKQQFAKTQGLLGHQRLVKEDAYLNALKEKMPFLSSYYNIYTTAPGGEIILHTDAKRNCALNIPIVNTEGSKTSFYEFAEEPKLVYNEKFAYQEIRSKVNEIFSFTLDKPTLINNAIPHSVKHNGKGSRVILSWSVKQEFSFLQAKELIAQCTLSSN